MNEARIALLASSVAALFAAAGCGSSEPSQTPDPAAQVQQASVRCVGINTCKGTSECQSADGKSACQGQNECAGQGWITVPSEAECRDKGGKLYSEAQASLGSGSSGAPNSGTSKPSSVQCEGINACKGQGSCQSADHACKGQNECAGHGWLEVPSADDCLSQGGTVRQA